MKSVFSLLVLGLVACGGGKSPPADMASHPEDFSSPVDLAGAGALGSPCTSASDCHEGAAPVCFRQLLFNADGNLSTPQGYCSSECNAQTDCGNDGVCRGFAGVPKMYCFAGCTKATDCRTGYACFNDLTCFPNGNLNCDPTSADGICTTAPTTNPGGCIRQAVGPGTTGICSDGCSSAADDCPPVNGTTRQCVVYDQTGDTDPTTGATQGDTFHGPTCSDNVSSNADGVECMYTPPGGTAKDYIDACTPGDECYLSAAFMGGDNLCHRLCSPNVDFGSACAGTQTCHDIFGLFSSATPIGLCMP